MNRTIFKKLSMNCNGVIMSFISSIEISFYVYRYFIMKWVQDESGIALMESVMLMPTMMVLLMGAYDIGNGIILNQKTITASQIAADLIAREKTVTESELLQAIEGARLAYEPYGLNMFGIDIVSIRFDENSQPEILWRETTDGMSPNDVAVESTAGMGEEGEGVVIVTVDYTYSPFFSSYFLEEFHMREVAFTRGRRGPTVPWES